jgi:hypothetical protein
MCLAIVDLRLALKLCATQCVMTLVQAIFADRMPSRAGASDHRGRSIDLRRRVELSPGHKSRAVSSNRTAKNAVGRPQ